MSLVSIPGYQVSEEVYNGSRTVVYRAVREIDTFGGLRQREPVAIKLLKNPYPSFSELVQFRNQYTIAKNLNSPLIVQTYSLEPYQNGYMLVMEDFGGISLKQYFTNVEMRYIASLDDFLEIAIALCNTLDILYHERIIHKDIKPSNILINPETKQVKLIDFSIASLLPRETQTLVNPNVLEGTLAYISPEQTGRMNRGIDYRTDFYSLGVTFYELLTGELPFASNDPMELVHSHLAKTAPLLHKINPQIPAIISEIVSKLMMKNAEDRYQSALGLKFDLEKCLHQLKETGEIGDFAIATRDVCDRFIIPDKLYGRETEVSTLLEAFERVSLGATEMMLVAGFSGIGKTAVVNEVHKPIARQRGYFIKGKYDQFQRNIPFSAFVQAFRDLMGQLLTESDVKIQEWKHKILEAVGDNGQVIIEVIPELAIIIGEQPPAVELSGTAAQNRFNLLFQKFTQVFTNKEHPLVIFLDDLQWADSASLKLMQLLMTDTGYLFIIGAYRDNEVNPGHPLLLTLSEIQKTQAIINTITLAPLSQLQVNKLIADTLKCSEELAWNLSKLIYEKTQGNPFFATQFLKALHQDRLIQFDFALGCWQCDIAQVMTLAVTDDVVAFMSLQLRKLPPSTQEVLRLAACIGNSFDLATLAIVAEQSQIETAACLWKALQEGLIVPIGDLYKFYIGQESIASTSENRDIVTYKFLHDRVQQAAYSLIPDDQKQRTHLKIGKLLLKNTAPEAIEMNVFDIVNQLNNGVELLDQISERYELAQLNLIAGKKAKTSTAYKAAIKHFLIGIEILPEDSWQTDYHITFKLYREYAECQYLTGCLNEAEQLFDVALQYAQNKFDLADIYCLKLALKVTQGENLPAYEAGLSGLSVLGMSVPASEEGQQALLETTLKQIQNKLETVETADLFDLPAMSDPARKVCMSILPDLWGAAYTGGNQLLTILSILLMVETSLTYGNAESSGCAYCLYGMTLTIQGDYRSAYEFATLGRKLDRRFNSVKFIPKTNNVFAHTINPYNRPLVENVAVYQQSFQVSNETGDSLFGIWTVVFIIWTHLLKGDYLSDVYAETEKYLSYIQQVNNVNMSSAFNLQREFILYLQDLLVETDLLVDHTEQKILCLDIWQKNHFDPGINWYCFLKLQLLYLYGRYADALKVAATAEKTLASNLGFFPIIQFHFYYPLNLAGIYPEATPEEQQEYWQQMQQHQKILESWVQSCPENFLHQSLLLAAEMARVSGNYKDAITCYDRAITAAKENHFTQIEALANELAAKFYLDWGKQRLAQEYMIEAYYAYGRWGAKAKVADLEQRYPQLLAPILQQTRSLLSTDETIFTLGTFTSTSSATSSSSVSNSLDLKAILKASQTISGEIELSKLLSSLLEIIIENAGANKCVLMLLRDSRLLIKGLITEGSKPDVLQKIPVEDSQEIPLKLIYKVLHHKNTVVLVDATGDLTLANDPYIIRQQPKSILCSPILHQGKLMGILYLENNLAMGAFTSDRVELLNLLCAQAAISLENARLYECSQNYAQQLEESLNSLSASNSRFHSLVNNVPGVVFQYPMSADGVISLNYISANCYNLLEITPEQAMSDWQFFQNMVHPDDIASFLQSQTYVIQTESSWHWEGRIITPSGIIKWIHGESQIQRFADGSMVWDGLFLDISEQQAALRERKRAEQELQNAQLQIVQSEKMSALGNLVAGVAHEMNNPLGFIAASLEQAKPTLADIVKHLKLYQENLPNPADEIIEHAEEIDLDYSLSDLPKIIDSMSMACDRLKNISTSLRTFSRADRDYKVPFNIHEGIDSTILILKHRLKANEQRPAIEVITDYGNLPQVECFPGQLNQVFMNLLANAIDALDESNAGRSFAEIKANPNCITITTSIENSLVKIAILDNGKGMSEQVKSKIFDHLFTTKAVGKGTGLGLAIARQIVEETHGGKLSFNSVIGEGTEFIIEIPV
ncbi:trifunctional serine/threonine-protein kinase/ATP-binding protein/sensor histidine kinase [Nostoc sp.]|uniref:trifunctional serine/threonine-protein kinase/ATP-binding protein/sensor histidine kinase n=1 Tax=Nostoc sp. TaxID=1180 RepID=UPI002FFC3F64